MAVSIEQNSQTQPTHLMDIENSEAEAKLTDVDLRYIIRRKIEDRLDRKRLIEEFGPVDDLDF
jgi:hypothetical protein